MCLKRLNYDRKELERRREESVHQNKGELTSRRHRGSDVPHVIIIIIIIVSVAPQQIVAGFICHSDSYFNKIKSVNIKTIITIKFYFQL